MTNWAGYWEQGQDASGLLNKSHLQMACRISLMLFEMNFEIETYRLHQPIDARDSKTIVQRPLNSSIKIF